MFSTAPLREWHWKQAAVFGMPRCRLHRLRHLAEAEEAPMFGETLVVADLDVVAGQVASDNGRPC